MEEIQINSRGIIFFCGRLFLRVRVFFLLERKPVFRQQEDERSFTWPFLRGMLLSVSLPIEQGACLNGSVIVSVLEPLTAATLAIRTIFDCRSFK